MKNKGKKGFGWEVAFFVIIFLMVANIIYMAITGIHFISGQDIRYYARNVRSETTQTIKASRGNIYSYDGDLIATDRIAYNVVAYLSEDRLGYQDQIPYVDKPELCADVLSNYITNKTRDEIYAFLTDEDLYQYTFKASLTSVQVEQLKKEMEEKEINGIEFSKTTSRSYQYGHFSSYIIGIVDTNDDDPDNVISQGAFGLELAYDDMLRGTDGKKTFQADSSGRAIANARLTETKAVDGADMYVSFDSELQNTLESQLTQAVAELGISKMWCTLMDAKTGRILANVSRPDFDLTDRSTIVEYQDYFLNNTYEVGSVVKPFIYLTAMEAGVYNGDELYPSGTVYVDDSPGMPPIQDYNWGVGWGNIPYDEGLIHSSNTAITLLIQEKGIFNQVVDIFDKLGFFQHGVVDGLDAASGWASYIDTQSMYDMVTMCFGQSATYSPYDILRAFSVFANDGKMVEPYFVDRMVDKEGNTLYSAKATYSKPIFNKNNIDHVRSLLNEVVNNDEIGTGYRYHDDSISIFGKTGTGQIWDNDINGYSRAWECYSFVGGAPYENPEVLVFIGCEGNNSQKDQNKMADVVRTMLKSALAKRNIQANGDHPKITDVTIGSYVNQSVDFAKERLTEDGLKYTLVGDGAIVKKQYPQGDALISSAANVYLYTDGSNYTLPDFTGWSRQDIAAYLSFFDLSLKFSGNGQCVSQSVDANTNILDVKELTIQLE